MVKFLDLKSQYDSIKPEIDAALQSVIDSSAFIGGEHVKSFEESFGDYIEAEHCIGVGNGTDAIEIVLEALGLPEGSEVIVPANSFIASSEAVSRCGFKPVFADCGPDYTLDVEDTRQRITSNTSAIMAVHLYGHPCDMAGLAQLAKENNLRLIEDSAQAHGARFRDRRVGALGDAGTFSFYPGKNLGAYGDGGAIVTNDAELAEKARMVANHGRVAKYDHVFEGRNSRLDGMQAAILNVKLRHLDAWLDARNRIASRYLQAFGGHEKLVLPEVSRDVYHAYHLFVVRVNEREQLAADLKAQGIQTGIHYPIALPKLKAYEHLGLADADFFANRTDTELLSLPIGEHLDDGAVDRVIGAVLKGLDK